MYHFKGGRDSKDAPHDFIVVVVYKVIRITIIIVVSHGILKKGV
jgi:hypothetical protein